MRILLIHSNLLQNVFPGCVCGINLLVERGQPRLLTVKSGDCFWGGYDQIPLLVIVRIQFLNKINHSRAHHYSPCSSDIHSSSNSLTLLSLWTWIPDLSSIPVPRTASWLDTSCKLKSASNSTHWGRVCLCGQIQDSSQWTQHSPETPATSLHFPSWQRQVTALNLISTAVKLICSKHTRTALSIWDF